MGSCRLTGLGLPAEEQNDDHSDDDRSCSVPPMYDMLDKWGATDAASAV